MFTPSASSRSAEPHLLVLERLPCLATAQPAPAATSAAVVETLKVEGPPPVPAVSTRSSRFVATGAASARIVRASPTSSGTVSPLARRAIRKAPVCTSLDASLHDLGEDRGGVVGGQVVAGADRVDRPAEDLVYGRVAHRAEPRKLASRCLPCGVSTDSGWNWTPSAGSSRWRAPITTSPRLALSSSSSGRSGSATSEW